MNNISSGTSRFCIIIGAAILLAGAFSAFGQKDYSIAAIQGDKNISQYEGQRVRTTGIVTARTRSGFFIQTPDDKIDADPNTSEGIFVFTKAIPNADAVPGNLVSVTGYVDEYRPKSEQGSLPVTEISFKNGSDIFEVISKSKELPKPVALSVADFKLNSRDELEKYEGMRVVVNEMTVVGPTGGRIDHKNETVVSDGIFYGVVKGIPRPFREPGMEIADYQRSSDLDRWKKEIPHLPIFDSNPETIRVDTSEQVISSSFSGGGEAETNGITGGMNKVGAALNVTAKSEIKNLSGVMHYAFGKYTILTDVDTKPIVSNTIKPLPLPQTTDRQFSIASTNIETLVDDVDDPAIKEDVVTTAGFQKRLGKISMAIRDYLQMPDVIAVVEAENLNVLKQLADKVNSEATAAGKPNPKYEAYLFEGNDGRGIDCGFLIKSTRVTVIAAKQFGKDDKYTNPVTKNEDNLNDRTPIMVELQIADTKTNQPFAFTVVANHLKSYRGINDVKDGPNVRMKKRLQAELLAKWVNERQKANPNERILLVGDFNAFQFSDGVVDVIGTIKGTPAPKDSVLLASEDLVNPDLYDLVDMIKADQQYSYSFDGNAQVLDHFIATAAFKKQLVAFGYLRVNADFPAVYRADGNRVERFSDHDVAIGYFTFDEPAKVKSN